MPEPKVALIYTGDGAFYPGIPARSLTAAEVEKHGGLDHLLSTGLYALPLDKNPVAAAPDEPPAKSRKKGA